MVSLKYKYIFKLDKRTATDLIFFIIPKNIYKRHKFTPFNIEQVPTFGCCCFVCLILEVKLYFLYIFNLKILSVFCTLIFHTFICR